MKKIVLIVTLMLLVNSVFSMRGVTFGPRGSFNVSDFYGEDDTQSRNNYSFGLFYNAETDIIGFQLEVLYSSFGAESNNTKVSLTYIQIPILFKLMLPLGIVKPGILIGPAVGFNIDAVSEYDGNEMDLDNVKPFDHGFIMGLGLEIEIGPGKLILDTRYYLGLGKIFESGSKAKNSVFLFGIGYGFYLERFF